MAWTWVKGNPTRRSFPRLTYSQSHDEYYVDFLDTFSVILISSTMYVIQTNITRGTPLGESQTFPPLFFKGKSMEKINGKSESCIGTGWKPNARSSVPDFSASMFLFSPFNCNFEPHICNFSPNSKLILFCFWLFVKRYLLKSENGTEFFSGTVLSEN